jgi:hypothetical protein
MVTNTISDTLKDNRIYALTPLEYAEVQRQAAAPVIDALNQANATIKTLQDAAVERDRAYDVLVSDTAILMDENRRFSAEIDRLNARIADLQKPPVVVPPVVEVKPTSAPVISKTELRNVRGACITLGLEAPSPAIDAAARELMHLIQRMGFNVVRFFRNKDEVRDDLKRPHDDPRNLYAIAKKLNLVVVADTVNRAAEMYSDTELSQYLAGLKSLGAAALVFDDANQYFDAKNPDGSLKFHPTALAAMVGRVRRFSELPLIASVRANAAVGEYKPLFDFMEIQGFGNPEELRGFLKLERDAIVLPAEEKNSLDYFRRAHDVILDNPPDAAFWYSAFDEKTNWLEMPDKVALIEKTVQAMKAKTPA